MAAILNLVVIRSQNAERLAEFYEAVGLEFHKHQHGKGLEHFAAELRGSVFEIYPLQGSALPTTGVRLGFQVEDIHSVFASLVNKGAQAMQYPSASPWGERAVIKDMDGHVVELLHPVSSQADPQSP
jgi:lactoylglutathione lyase